MQRVAVIGIGGSGKTTVARLLSARLGLPVYHMDALFWRGKWEEVPEEEYLARHAELVAQDRWIIEGYVDASMASRLHRADRIVFLDYSGARCLWRVLKRYWLHRKEARPELHPDAVEEVIWKFWWTVLTRAERPGILRALDGTDSAKVQRVRNSGELKSVLR
jgi:adenylate kinase family enzyme